MLPKKTDCQREIAFGSVKWMMMEVSCCVSSNQLAAAGALAPRRGGADRGHRATLPPPPATSPWRHDAAVTMLFLLVVCSEMALTVSRGRDLLVTSPGLA